MPEPDQVHCAPVCVAAIVMVIQATDSPTLWLLGGGRQSHVLSWHMQDGLAWFTTLLGLTGRRRGSLSERAWEGRPVHA